MTPDQLIGQLINDAIKFPWSGSENSSLLTTWKPTPLSSMAPLPLKAGPTSLTLASLQRKHRKCPSHHAEGRSFATLPPGPQRFTSTREMSSLIATTL